MKIKKFLIVILAVAFASAIFAADDEISLSRIYRFNTARILEQVTTTDEVGSTDQTLADTENSVSAPIDVTGACRGNLLQFAYVGDDPIYGGVISVLCDDPAFATFYGRVPKSAITSFLQLRDKDNATLALSATGLLAKFTDPSRTGVAKFDMGQAWKVARGESLFSDYRGIIVAGQDQNLQLYNLEDSQLSTSSLRQQPSGPANCINPVGTRKGDLLCVQLETGTVYRIPTSLAGLRWDFAAPFYKATGITRVATDGNKLFVLIAPKYRFVNPLEPAFGPLVAQIIAPGRIVSMGVKDDGPSEVSEVRGSIVFSPSATSGLLARNGVVYYVARDTEGWNDLGEKIVRFDGKSETTVYTTRYSKGRGSISGLSFYDIK